MAKTAGKMSKKICEYILGKAIIGDLESVSLKCHSVTIFWFQVSGVIFHFVRTLLRKFVYSKAVNTPFDLLMYEILRNCIQTKRKNGDLPYFDKGGSF